MLQEQSTGLYLITRFNPENGSYCALGWTQDKANASTLHPYGGKNETGYLNIDGLPVATYTLTQEQVPHDYSLIRSPIHIEISSDDGCLTFSVDSIEPQELSGGTVRFDITNMHGYPLPDLTTPASAAKPAIIGWSCVLATIVCIPLYLWSNKNDS